MRAATPASFDGELNARPFALISDTVATRQHHAQQPSGATHNMSEQRQERQPEPRAGLHPRLHPADDRRESRRVPRGGPQAVHRPTRVRCGRRGGGRRRRARRLERGHALEGDAGQQRGAQRHLLVGRIMPTTTATRPQHC